MGKYHVSQSIASQLIQKSEEQIYTITIPVVEVDFDEKIFVA